ASLETAGGDHLMVFNVGDSRVYRVGADRLDQVTTDHSEVEELVLAGTLTREQARTHPRRNIVTRALGSNRALLPDYWLLPAIAGDSYWALIDAVPDSAVVTEIWHRMQQVSRLDALVASVLRFGLDGVPDFVLLAAAEGGHRLICRGRAGATLIGSDPPRRVD